MKKMLSLCVFAFMLLATTFAQTEDKYAETLKEMFRVSGSEQTYEVAINQMLTIFKQQGNGVSDEIWNELEVEFKKTSMDDLTVMMIPVYKKHLTLEDLEAMIAFYKTPIGKKYAKATPLIMQESMQVGAQWGAQIGEKMQKRIQELSE